MYFLCFKVLLLIYTGRPDDVICYTLVFICMLYNSLHSSKCPNRTIKATSGSLSVLHRSWNFFSVILCCTSPVHDEVPAGQRCPVFMEGGPTVVHDELQLWVSRLHQPHLKIQRLPQIFLYWIIFCLVEVIVWWIWRRRDPLEKGVKTFKACQKVSEFQSYLGLDSFAHSAALSRSLLWVHSFFV